MDEKKFWQGVADSIPCDKCFLKQKCVDDAKAAETAGDDPQSCMEFLKKVFKKEVCGE